MLVNTAPGCRAHIFHTNNGDGSQAQINGNSDENLALRDSRQTVSWELGTPMQWLPRLQPGYVQSPLSWLI